MDYRNADGVGRRDVRQRGPGARGRSPSGSGVWDGTGELVLGTRAGVRRRPPRPPTPTAVPAPGTPSTWGRGAARRQAAAVDAGRDAEVRGARALAAPRAGAQRRRGQPAHRARARGRGRARRAPTCTRRPGVTPAPPRTAPTSSSSCRLGERDGPTASVGALRMRVHERGVGETRSCGTGACAAALAVRAWAGAGAPDVWWVEVPGRHAAGHGAAGRPRRARPAPRCWWPTPWSTSTRSAADRAARPCSPTARRGARDPQHPEALGAGRPLDRAGPGRPRASAAGSPRRGCAGPRGQRRAVGLEPGSQRASMRVQHGLAHPDRRVGPDARRTARRRDVVGLDGAHVGQAEVGCRAAHQVQRAPVDVDAPTRSRRGAAARG